MNPFFPELLEYINTNCVFIFADKNNQNEIKFSRNLYCQYTNKTLVIQGLRDIDFNYIKPLNTVLSIKILITSKHNISLINTYTKIKNTYCNLDNLTKYIQQINNLFTYYHFPYELINKIILESIQVHEKIWEICDIEIPILYSNTIFENELCQFYFSFIRPINNRSRKLNKRKSNCNLKKISDDVFISNPNCTIKSNLYKVS